MSSRDYHLTELAIAQAGVDERRILPSPPPGIRRVLDLGCGAGQALLAMDLHGAVAVGLDLDIEALGLGRQIAPAVHFLRANGDRLPFETGSFDFVFSRVALPYMDIPEALREMARVLTPGGGIWLTLHPVGIFPWRNSFVNLKTVLFEVYRLANTATLHCLNWQFRFPLKRSRMESYQTVRGMRVALERAGFEEIRFVREAHFLVIAKRR